jgi:hypothetical protein
LWKTLCFEALSSSMRDALYFYVNKLKLDFPGDYLYFQVRLSPKAIEDFSIVAFFQKGAEA